MTIAEVREQYGVQERPHPTAPPFLPGDLIVSIAHPESGAVTVSVIVDKGQGWRVGYTGPAYSGVVGSAPANHFVLAPKGWQDAPLIPVGSARYGLCEADREAALAEDEADPELQAALRRWRAGMVAWEVVWVPLIQKTRRA